VDEEALNHSKKYYGNVRTFQRENKKTGNISIPGLNFKYKKAGGKAK
jgi:hypothetical protein